MYRNYILIFILVAYYHCLGQDTVNYRADIYESCVLPEGGAQIETHNRAPSTPDYISDYFVVNLVDQRGSLMVDSSNYRFIGMRGIFTFYNKDTTIINEDDTLIIKKNSIHSWHLARVFWKNNDNNEIDYTIDNLIPNIEIQRISKKKLIYSFYLTNFESLTSPVLISTGKIKLRYKYRHKKGKRVDWHPVLGKEFRMTRYR